MCWKRCVGSGGDGQKDYEVEVIAAPAVGLVCSPTKNLCNMLIEGGATKLQAAGGGECRTSSRCSGEHETILAAVGLVHILSWPLYLRLPPGMNEDY